MSTISRRRIRCKIDAAQRTNFKFIDSKTTSTPEFWRGNDLQFEIGIAWNGSLITDISNIASLTLQVKASAAATEVLMTKTLSAGDLDNTVTEANWTDDTKQHALVTFTGTESNIVAGTYHLVVSVVTNDSPGRDITLGATTLTVTEDGAGSSGTPQVTDGLAYTHDEADARFVQKHEDQAWMRFANGRWYIYETTTALWYPLVCTIKDGVAMFTPGEGVSL
jgi:hypothetical protein